MSDDACRHERTGAACPYREHDVMCPDIDYYERPAPASLTVAGAGEPSLDTRATPSQLPETPSLGVADTPRDRAVYEAVTLNADSFGEGVYAVCERCDSRFNNDRSDPECPTLAALIEWAESHDCK